MTRSIPIWATQHQRWWPALLLLQRLDEHYPGLWAHVRLESDPASSTLDFDLLASTTRSWTWEDRRLLRLARALHQHQRGVDVMELVEGLDQQAFRIAVEAIAAAGPLL